MKQQLMTGKHYIVSGRVQGVFFRAFVIDRANRLGLAGWVRNLTDGTVEAFAEGTTEQLEAFALALHQGSRMSLVQHVTETDIPSPEPISGFRQRPTCSVPEY